MKYKLLRFSLLSVLVMLFGGLAFAQDAGGSLITDELTLTTFGVSGTNYTSASDVTATSSAVYAAQMAGGNSAIQLRSNSSNSGIVTTASGGTVKSIKVEWNSATADARTLDVYGKGDAYSAPTELYSSETQGTKIASFVKSDGTKEITIDGSYAFIGFRSNSGAMYIDKITIVWDSNAPADNRIATTMTIDATPAATAGVGDMIIVPSVTVKDGDGNPIPSVSNDIVFTNETPAIAEVNAGNITFIAPGEAKFSWSFAGNDEYKACSASCKVTVSAPPYTTIADMLKDITTNKTNITYNFENLLVKYVNGSNTYVSDGQNNMLLYGKDLGLNAGDIVSGSIKGQLYLYNALPEIAVNAADVNVTVASSDNEVIPSIIEISALENNINNYVVIENAEYVSVDSKNLTFKVGETEFIARNNWEIDITALEAGKVYTLTGIGSVYNTTYQLYLISFEEKTAQEPEQYVYRDFAVNLTNQALLNEDEKAGIADESNKNPAMNIGIVVDAEGNITRVANDAANANAVLTGKWHSNEHGWSNFSATVPVVGAVKITFGTCAWGGDVEVKNAQGVVVATMNTNTGACYHNDMEANVVSCYYKTNEATTLTVSGGSYVPYFAVKAVNPDEIPSDVKFVYDIANAGAQGTAPETETVAIGKDYTLPKNFTLYKEGMTLTGWSDGTNTYALGETITAPEAAEVTLTPVFTENEVSLADRTEPVTLKFNFRRDAGAPTVAYQNATGIWVTQATIGEKTIDVKADFDTNNGGKFANGNWTDWAQLNSGTKFTIPSCKGATVSMEAYSNITTTTIDGQADYTQGTAISYEVAGAAETVDVVIGDGSYYRYIQVVLPVVQSQQSVGPFDNVAGTVNWLVGNEAVATISENIQGGLNAYVNVGADLTVTTAKYFDTEMVKYQPVTSNAGDVEGVMIEYRVKPVKGVTFKPTQVDYAAVKCGTDNATYSWSYTVDGVESTITKIDPKPNLLRDNNSNSSTAKLMHTETFANVNECSEFTFRFYISSTANNKQICIGNVTISGIVNGEPASVEMFSLATAVTPEDGGSVNVYPAAEQYEEGSEVTLTATENFGYDFVNWTNAAGDEVSTEAKFKYTVNADETLTANFKKVETYELALTVDGTNDYMVTVSPEPTVIDGKNMYEAGTTVELTANQYEGLVTFNNWSDGETNSSKLLKMEDNVTLTAIYEQADIIAGWDFYTTGGNGRKADFYAQDNDGDALNLVNTETGETQGWLDKSWLGAGGYESFKGAAVNWRTGTKNADVGNWHWQTKINAEAFTDINVQFQMLYNYNAYQTYNAEYSLDGENWTKFGSITMEGAKNAASFKEQLPAEANNQKDLFIRMIADKTSKVDGAESANDGNTLAMFFITGSPKLADDGVAPVLVSTVPADGATGASATGKIVLTFDERVKVAEGAMGMMAVNNGMSGAWRIEPVVSGKTVSFAYKGLEYGTQYKFQLAANTVGDLTDNMLAEDITINFTIMERPAIKKGSYDAVVENVDQLLAAISAAESRSDKNVRFRIFVKDGNYVIPVKENQLKSGAEMPDESGNRFQIPECITFIKSGNISFIGESRDGVIITNGIDKAETFAGKYGTTSKYDGIGNSDVFQISGSDYYFQDLTVETGMDDATGRDLAIQDKATRTIYKNTGLRGYQDTWTSNNDRGLYYFEGGYVRGRTDYMCGKGDAFFNGVELRQIAGGYAAVPSKPAKIGWVYKDCVINGEAATVNYATGETRSAKDVDGNYTLGRPWGSGTPVALFIDTKMNVVPSAIGWNEMSGGWPARFAEYNSMTSTGSVIDLSGRKKIFADTHENNPVLSADEALQYSDMSLMFGDWQPTLATEQAPIPTNVILTGSELTWDDSNYALLWAVCKDGKVIGFTVEPTFTITEDGKYTVRAANEMGGLSEASAVATVATGIETVETAQPAADNSVYTLQGVRVDKARKGLYIINGRKVVIK